MHPSPLAASPIQDGRFLLLEALGHGGMGTVYRAFDRSRSCTVALKVTREQGVAGPSHPLSREFEIWSGLSHPNIVAAREMVIAQAGPIPAGSPYLVLEDIPGLPAHVAVRPGRLGPRLLLAIARQLLRALEHVHAAGWLHRDLKPANALVCAAETGRPRIRLTDFGLAVPLEKGARPGEVSGSLPYLAPEAWLGRPLDERSDLYGLGILLHYLATGELPSRAAEPESMLRWHLDGPPLDPSGRRTDLSPRLVRLVQRLTVRDLDHRPRDAARALRLLGSTHASPTRLVSAPTAVTGERARLRLALDAARLGAWRELAWPASAGTATSLVQQLSTWAQIRGLSVVHSAGTATELCRAVLRLLHEAEPHAVGALERFGLEQVLPVDRVGELPLWSLPRAARHAAGLNVIDVSAQARRLAAFVASMAMRATRVVVVDTSQGCDPLVRAFVGELRRRIRRIQHPGPSGGLLLLAPTRETTTGGGPHTVRRALVVGAEVAVSQHLEKEATGEEDDQRPGEHEHQPRLARHREASSLRRKAL